jgi:hypothetical protein
MGPCPLAAVVRLLAYSSRAGSQCDADARSRRCSMCEPWCTACAAGRTACAGPAARRCARASDADCGESRRRCGPFPSQHGATSCSQPRRRARAVRTRRKGSPHGRWKSACVSVRARVWAACGHACAGITRRAGELSCLNRRGLCCEVGIVERVAPVGFKRNRQHFGRAGQPAVLPGLARVCVVVPALER